MLACKLILSDKYSVNIPKISVICSVIWKLQKGHQEISFYLPIHYIPLCKLYHLYKNTFQVLNKLSNTSF